MQYGISAAEGEFLQHLHLHKFKQLTSSTVKYLGINEYRNYSPSWVVIMHPIVTMDQEPRALTKFLRYIQVLRLHQLLVDRPSELDRGWLDTAQTILYMMAPKSMSNMTHLEVWEVLTEGELKFFDEGEVVFKEGDAPDGYYTCLHGAVAVHKRPQTDEEADAARTSPEAAVRDFGRVVVELKAGAGFGEVAFSTHSEGRAASIVARGEAEMLELDEPAAVQFARTACFVRPPARKLRPYVVPAGVERGGGVEPSLIFRTRARAPRSSRRTPSSASTASGTSSSTSRSPSSSRTCSTATGPSRSSTRWRAACRGASCGRSSP